MADYTPVYAGGAQPMTKTASTSITGGTLVEATTASAVGTAGAASTKVVGVAAHDAASGARVTVWPLNNVEHEITSTGTIAVGDGIASGASGVAATAAVATAAAAGTLIGRATTGATGGAKVRFVGGS
ncbi:capsid cement protein [Micromonospora cathayae]|uniref:DUF2190 family protein n=1 Tax=Micromonospora cathayae TaxID=3028804 RepID=A0ABY7ZYL9_9ACTN|nr:capsid cement protein [Micromonospora sp. HUAS 3]WDZ87192.1 DUF2190 family protein [Micromonospora sp. HUAS 3]